MHSAKENIQLILEKMPNSASYEDIMYEIYVNQQIDIGLEQVKNGELISEEKALERLKKWLR